MLLRRGQEYARLVEEARKQLLLESRREVEETKDSSLRRVELVRGKGKEELKSEEPRLDEL